MDYRYTALTNNGELVRGTISGASQATATEALIGQGIQPIRIKPKILTLPSFQEAFPSFYRIKTEDVIMFSRQLATLIDAGISIIPALNLIGEQTRNRRFRKIIDRMAQDLSSGSSFSDAITQYPDVFNEVYCPLISVGEQVGELETVLRRAADYLEKDLASRKKIKRALTYPAIVLTVLVLVITVLMVYVLPKMVDTFESMDTSLPVTTRILIDINDFVSAAKFYLFLGGIFTVGAVIALSHWSAARLKFHRATLKTPVIGKVVRISEMARFSRMLKMLINTGLLLPDILALIARTSNNLVIKRSLENVRTGLLQGEGLADPMAREKLFPHLMVQMVMVGEESGQMDSMMETVAKAYESEADETIERMISMIEPVMTVLLAIIIGFIAVSIVTPIYSIGDSLK